MRESGSRGSWLDVRNNMANVKEMRIFCAEQISVPEELPEILKNYSKEVIRNNPPDIYAFSARYFEKLLEQRGKPDALSTAPKPK